MTERPKLLRLKKRVIFSLQPKEDSQVSKIPFRDYRWIGSFVIKKVLTYDKNIVRRLNTNKTKVLYRSRLKHVVPNTPFADEYSGEKIQPNDEIVIPQFDLYTISW